MGYVSPEAIAHHTILPEIKKRRRSSASCRQTSPLLFPKSRLAEQQLINSPFCSALQESSSTEQFVKRING
ncbi:MAG: hypothetical protein KME40_23085 [Komarekiella atlantica HA4396-MV6]|jgi:hypothetical protein|nr:hypothetical protein [Komarekiella atlantica HA4396-MV6]